MRGDKNRVVSFHLFSDMQNYYTAADMIENTEPRYDIRFLVPNILHWLEQHLNGLFFSLVTIMFVIGYFESLRWPMPGPKATHGILKGLLLLGVVLILFQKKHLKLQQNPIQNLIMLILLLIYTLSSLFSLVPGTSLLNLWYPSISLFFLYVFSKIRVKRSYIFVAIAVSSFLIFATASFAFFSLLNRYSVDNIYYFIFLDHRANYFLNELRKFGKYASLGPYIMLSPLCLSFLVLPNQSWTRKLLSVLTAILSVITAIMSNNRIDVLITAIHFMVFVILLPRKASVLLLLLSLFVIQFSLTTAKLYYGFNLEERILRPKVERDLETVDMRFTYWQTALYNFKTHPWLGTGPNTYNDISDFPLRRYFIQGSNQYTVEPDEGIGIHNLFIERLADTGLFGFLAFVIMIFYFFRIDIIRIFNRPWADSKVYILFSLSSWTWILYGITDNGYGAQGFITFFYLRGLINHL